MMLSISEAAEALGVSDDLVYELTVRGDLPCLRLGRRKVIPRRAIELVVEAAIDGFDAGTLQARLFCGNGFQPDSDESPVAEASPSSTFTLPAAG